MKTFALALLAGATQAASIAMTNYMEYIAKYEKQFQSMDDFHERYELFNRSSDKIAEMNQKNSLATFGHNIFSDWTKHEYMSMMGLQNEEVPKVYMNATSSAVHTNGDSIDWRDVKDVVTPVKDQGQCGSCWAFSATETVESAYVIAGHDQVILAPQELVDCSKGLLSNHGCNGGMYYHAWKWEKTHMAMREEDYPYTSGTTGDETDCAYDESKGVTYVADYKQVSADTDSIKAAIQIEPVSVAVAAGNDVFMHYTGGIVTAADDCPTKIDHAVVAVGYGYENGQGYYIVRNSWNTTWGDQGYVKLGMAEGAGICGINQVVYYPTI